MNNEQQSSAYMTRQAKKRLHRTMSEDLSNSTMTFKRAKLTNEALFQVAPKSFSSQFLHRPFTHLPIINFTVPQQIDFDLNPNKSFLLPLSLSSFQIEYMKMKNIHGLMQDKSCTQEKKEKKLSLKDSKMQNLEVYFQSGCEDLLSLSQILKLPLSSVKNAFKKFKEGKSLLKDYRGRKEILNKEHCDFIEQYFTNPVNFDKTVMDLYNALLDAFIFTNKFSFWALYNYMKKLKFSYKQVIFKVQNANTPSVKNKRKEVALKIMKAHISGFDFAYIDEVSFNINLRIKRGWAKLGTHQNVSIVSKSKNYSVIMAMDFKGIIAIKIIKGGVKGADFFLYVKELIDSEQERFSSRKMILFMDNASIHRTKDFMQKLEKYQNIFYNSPYTPQLNPIEFAFSKIKSYVRKCKSTTEKDLIKNIYNAANEITESDATNYIKHSFNFLGDAVEEKDFY